MNTTPEEVRSRPVLANAAHLWAGPSFFFSTGRYGGWQLLAGGWRYRCTEWEHRFADAGLLATGEADTPWGWPAHVLTAAEAQPTEGCEELEVILDSAGTDYLDMPGLADALRTVLGDDAAADLMALPPPGLTSIARNRPLLADSATDLRVADLRFSTLPYGHSDPDRPVQYASRWLRLVASGDAVVSLWAPLEGHWQPEYVRWPHHAVPSRRVESVRLAARPATPAARLASILGDCLEHEAYFLDTWQMELEAWESNVYSSLAEGESVLRGVDLSDPVRARAGTLATFLSRTEFDLRALRRRLAVESLFDAEEVQQTVQPGLERATRTQTENQRLRREAFSLLTSIAAGEQLQATRDQADAADAARQATEALQQTIAWVTALLLAPTIVIGIFGANIVQVSPDSTGTLLQLGQWAVLASGLSMAVLWWRMPPPTVRPAFRRVPTALAVLLLGVGIALTAAGHVEQAVLWSATVAVWLAAALVALRRPGAPLVLGGVEIPSDKGFHTHSDGDVLCHAVIDALAGAMADGDLGTHYPEDDPAAENARSLDFVTEFAGYVRDHGYEIINLDSFVVLGPVKLRPHIEAMRSNLAVMLDLPIGRVSVKARSNDYLGDTGRGEAVAAWAHVLLLAAAELSY